LQRELVNDRELKDLHSQLERNMPYAVNDLGKVAHGEDAKHTISSLDFANLEFVKRVVHRRM
jgi:hypothetical protein